MSISVIHSGYCFFTFCGPKNIKCLFFVVVLLVTLVLSSLWGLLKGTLGLKGNKGTEIAFRWRYNPRPPPSLLVTQVPSAASITPTQREREIDQLFLRLCFRVVFSCCCFFVRQTASGTTITSLSLSPGRIRQQACDSNGTGSVPL